MLCDLKINFCHYTCRRIPLCFCNIFCTYVLGYTLLLYSITWFSETRVAVNYAPFLIFDGNCRRGGYFIHHNIMQIAARSYFMYLYVNCGFNNLYSYVKYYVQGYLCKNNFSFPFLRIRTGHIIVLIITYMDTN